MSQPTNPRRPHLHTVTSNPESPSSRSNLKAIVITAAVTAVVGVAAVGIAQGAWGVAKRRALRLGRRNEEQQTPQPIQPPVGYPVQYAAAYPAANGGYVMGAWPGPHPSAARMPDALAQVPNLVTPPSSMPQPPQPQPVPVVVSPGPDVTAEIRRLGTQIDKRFAAVEQRIADLDAVVEDDDDEDEEEDEEEEEAPRRRSR